MAVGEAVSVYTNASASFQPAATVEVMVLLTMISTGDDSIGFTNGVSVARAYFYNGSNSTPWVKWLITNTDYYLTDTVAANTGFSGIQIK